MNIHQGGSILWRSLLCFLCFTLWFKVHGQVSFPAQILDSSVQIGYGLAIGDVDGDGRDDILLADKKVFLWYRNPDWKSFVLVENLTERDNVCLAARDLDGDGRVEIAVGGQWNPGETTDLSASGSVHYLVRPENPGDRWTPIRLEHEPTVHRMRWIKAGTGYQLIVLPLHGRGNQGGRGAGVRTYAYVPPDDPQKTWTRLLIDSSLHITHNMDVVEDGQQEILLIGGAEGAKQFEFKRGAWIEKGDEAIADHGFGEIRAGDDFIAGIQPFHGETLAIYPSLDSRKVLTHDLKQGHALACSDLLGLGRDQIVVGWRSPNQRGEIGVKIFMLLDDAWHEEWIDQNGMACEDLKVADLDGDGRMDIVAAGRSTHNLKIYWNKN